MFGGMLGVETSVLGDEVPRFDDGSEESPVSASYILVFSVSRLSSDDVSCELKIEGLGTLP